MTEKKPYVSASDVLEDTSHQDGGETLSVDAETQKLLDEIPQGMNYQYFTEKMGHPNPQFEWRSKFSDYLRKAHPEYPVKTVVAQPGHRTGPFHWDGRRFTVTEFARLQSFPFEYEWPEAITYAREQIGNSVPPKLAQSIAESLCGEHEDVRVDELPSPRRGRTHHTVYKKRTHDRLTELYSSERLSDEVTASHS